MYGYVGYFYVRYYIYMIVDVIYFILYIISDCGVLASYVSCYMHYFGVDFSPLIFQFFLSDCSFVCELVDGIYIHISFEFSVCFSTNIMLSNSYLIFNLSSLLTFLYHFEFWSRFSRYFILLL